MTLKKERIIDQLLIETGLARSEAWRMTGSLLGIIKHTLESGEDILGFSLRGFDKAGQFTSSCRIALKQERNEAPKNSRIVNET